MDECINNNTIEDKVKDYLEKGKTLFYGNKIREGFAFFDKALELDKNYPETYLVKGEAHIGMFDSEEAEECLQKYLKLVPNSKQAYFDLIEVYDQLIDFKKAIHYCDKYIELDSTNVKVYLKKADLLTPKAPNEALAAYNTCLELMPDCYKALCYKGELLSDMGETEEAMEAFDKAIEVDNTKGDAFMGKALLYKHMKDKKNALSYAKKAYDLDPKEEWFKCQYALMKGMYGKLK